ncbi:MAG: hypothetical protein Kow0074_22220 [Candidatus Zixiibacteriota bacterium]
MWREVRRVISAEWLKRRHSRGISVGPIIYTLILIVIYAGYEIAARESVIGIDTGFFVAGSALAASTTPLAFLVALIVSYAIAREFSQGTIQLVWTRPIGRRGWLNGKTIFGVCEACAYVLLTVLVILVAAWLRLGFESLTEKAYVIHTQSALWGHLMLAIGLTTLGLIAVIAVASIPALVMSSPGGALAAMIIAGFVMQIGGSWGVLQPYLLTTYISQPLEQFVAMSKGLPEPWKWSTLVRVCLIGSIVWGAAGWGVASVLATRKEITGS